MRFFYAIILFTPCLLAPQLTLANKLHSDIGAHICVDRKNGMFDSRFNTTILEIRDNKGEYVFTPEEWKTQQKKDTLHLGSGIYKVTLSCTNNGPEEIRNINQVSVDIQTDSQLRAVCLAAYRGNRISHLQGFLLEETSYNKNLIAAQKQLNERVKKETQKARTLGEEKTALNLW